MLTSRQIHLLQLIALATQLLQLVSALKVDRLQAATVGTQVANNAAHFNLISCYAAVDLLVVDIVEHRKPFKYRLIVSIESQTQSITNFTLGGEIHNQSRIGRSYAGIRRTFSRDYAPILIGGNRNIAIQAAVFLNLIGIVIKHGYAARITCALAVRQVIHHLRHIAVLDFVVIAMQTLQLPIAGEVQLAQVVLHTIEIPQVLQRTNVERIEVIVRAIE